MDLPAVNYFAVLIAALAAWLFGAAWYMSLGKAWMKAARLDPANAKPSGAPFAISFLAELVMAFVLAVVIGRGGGLTMVSGVATGILLWAGCMATILAVNHRYQGFGWDLTLIDAGHWLGVALLMSAVIGWFGA